MKIPFFNKHRDHDTFGYIAISRGLVTQDQIDVAIAQFPDYRIGEALVALGLITPAQRDSVMFAQMKSRRVSPHVFVAYAKEQRDSALNQLSASVESLG